MTFWALFIHFLPAGRLNMTDTAVFPFSGLGLSLGRIKARAIRLLRAARRHARGPQAKAPRFVARLFGFDLLLWLSREIRGS
jgi:hypothetical protein